jgi:L-fucose mutarotase
MVIAATPVLPYGLEWTESEATMLRGIHPLLSPDLLHALAVMGHGDRIAVVDANFPALSHAKRLIALPGVTAPAVLEAILSVLPIDDFEPHPVSVMQVVGDAAMIPEAVREFIVILAHNDLAPPARLERHAFYHAAAETFAVVQTGERRFYGNILLTKGVIPPDTPS